MAMADEKKKNQTAFSNLEVNVKREACKKKKEKKKKKKACILF